MKSRKRTMLDDSIDFASIGMKALLRDDFSKCFKPISAEELNGSGIFYIFSLFIRYLILLPFRIILFFLGTFVFLIYFSYGLILKNDKALERSFIFYVKVFAFNFGANIRHHGIKRRLNEPHVFVANHTSFLDFFVLSSHKFCHASISEAHGGLFGFLFRVILSKNGSLLFKRSEKNDREKTLNMLKEHVKKNKTPMLIFPEGTCVNNKYSVLYQRGAFELDAIVCPVAIKYKKNLLDPYWNTSKHSFLVHLLYLMSRWKLDVDVYWMDPVKKEENETTADFAMRIKKKISKQAGLIDVIWNGYFKSAPVLKDREILRESFKIVYYEHVEKEKENYDRNYTSRKIQNQENQTQKYFYDYDYDKYLSKVLEKYLEIKNNRSILEDAQTRRSLFMDNEDLLWLNQPPKSISNMLVPCNCSRKRVNYGINSFKRKDKDEFFSEKTETIYERLRNNY